MLFTSFTFFLILIPVLTIILLLVNFIFAPHLPYQEKGSAFECGFHSFLEQTRTPFTVVFFVFGLLFLLFDIELILVYPYIMSSYINDIFGLTLTLGFLGILTLGLVFELGKGALTLDSRQYLNNNKYIYVSNPFIKQKPININTTINTQKRMMTTVIMKKRNNNNRNKFLLIATIIIILITLPVLALLFTNHIYYLVIYIITITILSIAFYIIIYNDMSKHRKSELLLGLYAGLASLTLGILVKYYIWVYFGTDIVDIYENTIPTITWFSSLAANKMLFKTLFKNITEEGYNLFFIKQTIGGSTNPELPLTKTYLAMNADNQANGSNVNPNNQPSGSNINTNTYQSSRPSIGRSPPKSLEGDRVKLLDEQQFQQDTNRVVQERMRQQNIFGVVQQGIDKIQLRHTLNNSIMEFIKDTPTYFRNGEGKFVIADPDNVASTTNPYIDPNTKKPYTNRSHNTYTNNLEKFMQEFSNKRIQATGSPKGKWNWNPNQVLSEKDFNFFVIYFKHHFKQEVIYSSNTIRVRESLRKER